MFVEGTLRWQITEDCPWDLLMALAIRELAGIPDSDAMKLPAASPGVTRVGSAASGGTVVRSATETDLQRASIQWNEWWDRTVRRELRPLTTQIHPPHFEVFDRALDLQDLVAEHYWDAFAWAEARYEEYADRSMREHRSRAADVVEPVRAREHELRRQAGYFRLDLYVLPLAISGAWIVAPHTVVVSSALRADSRAFRDWFTPVVQALV